MLYDTTYKVPQVVKLMETKSKMVVANEWGEADMGGFVQWV